ncbi:MAG: rod shape-determining protein [Fuerstia sp.]|nr:rod shape-determining protein [Fuerstiella sp.]
MICAIDFGSCRIRSVFRNPQTPERLTMFSERSEYTLLTNTEEHRQALEVQSVSYAECDQALVVFGNRAARVQWLSRVPRTALLTDGNVPSDDAPARQMLSLLTESMLPAVSGSQNLCVLTVPGLRDGSDQANKSEAFLSRLVQMQGYEPRVVSSAEAALLATSSDAAFTGLSIVMGAESTTICVARLGVPIASETLAIGGNWIDAELAKQFKVQMFDEAGTGYLDIESIRQWKIKSGVNLKHALGDRERMLVRLYTDILERVCRSLTQMLDSAPVRLALNKQRLTVMLAGGAVMVDGLTTLLTEQLIQHDIADRILSVRIAPDPETSVVRGALIFGELEARAMNSEAAA